MLIQLHGVFMSCGYCFGKNVFQVLTLTFAEMLFVWVLFLLAGWCILLTSFFIFLSDTRVNSTQTYLYLWKNILNLGGTSDKMYLISVFPGIHSSVYRICRTPSSSNSGSWSVILLTLNPPSQPLILPMCHLSVQFPFFCCLSSFSPFLSVSNL